MQKLADAIVSLGALDPALLDALGDIGRGRLVLATDGVFLGRCFAFQRWRLEADRLLVTERGRALALEAGAVARVVALVPRARGTRAGTLRLLGDDGAAACEVHVPQESAAVFRGLVERFAAGAMLTLPEVVPPPAAARRNDDVDVQALRRAWDIATGPDPLRRVAMAFALPADQVLRLLGPRRAERLPLTAVHALFAHVTGTQRPLGVRAYASRSRCTTVIRPLGTRSGPDWIEARGPCALLQLQLEADAQCWSIARGDGRLSFEVLSAEGERRAALALGPDGKDLPELEER